MRSKHRPGGPAELGLGSRLRAPREPARVQVELNLQLASAGTTVKVWGSGVELMELEMMPWGLQGELQFWMENDEPYGGEEKDTLYKLFCSREPLTVKLEVQAIRSDLEAEVRKGKRAVAPLRVSGLVYEREVFEDVTIDAKKAPVARCYRLAFADPAQVQWTQHHPIELYTDKSLQDVLEANKTAAICVVCDGEALKKKKEHLFVSLSEEDGAHASFYDWLLWWCDRNDFLFSYLYETGTYRIAEKQAEAPKQKHLLSRADVARIWVRHIEASRVGARVRSATSSDPRTTPIKRKEAQAPLQRDFLLRPKVGAEFDRRGTLETARLRTREPLVFIDFHELPLSIIGPGDWIDATQDSKLFRAHGLALPEVVLRNPLRCTRAALSLVAVRPGRQGEGTDNGHQRIFTLDYVAQLEVGTERAPQLPAYLAPRYPRLIEGLIAAGPEEGSGKADRGKELEEIYELEKQEDTGLLRYRVKLPVFAGQTIRAPFDPGMQSGHFYFPLYKQARVLVALECERATIRAALDWRIGGQLPLESQGNQLTMGKKPSSAVILQTVYTDEKVVFTLQRKSGEDVQTVRLSEGELRVFVGEGTDDKARAKIKTTECTISKSKGVVLKVESPDEKCTQQLAIDGKSIVLRVKGEKEEARITQTADSVAIVAKDVTITGETLTIKSSKPSSWSCQETLRLQSKEALSIATEAALAVKAGAAATLDADSLSLVAKRDASVEGRNTTLKAKQALNGRAAKVELQGTASSTVKGASVEVNGTTAVTVKSSAVAKLDGAMVKVSGGLIQIG